MKAFYVSPTNSKVKTIPIPMPEKNEDLATRPEAENLLGIYTSLSNQSIKDTVNEFAGKNFSDFNQKLAHLVVDIISPISKEINKIQKDENFIDEVLNAGAEKANKIASEKIKKIKKIIGF